MYLLLIAVAMGLAYLALWALFPLFFRQDFGPLGTRALGSLIGLFVLSLLITFISRHVPDAELGNRFLHTVGGGMLGVVAAFLAARDSGVSITRFQFFVFGSLLIVALGVGNELIEFALQSTTHLVFADTLEDTWLDLASNTAGILIAQVILLPFHRSKAAGPA